MVEALLRAGATPKSSTSDGETALMTAARAGSQESVKALLARGADVNAGEGWLGQTALMLRRSTTNRRWLRHWLEAGADVNAESTAVLVTPRSRGSKA